MAMSRERAWLWIEAPCISTLPLPADVVGTLNRIRNPLEQGHPFVNFRLRVDGVEGLRLCWRVGSHHTKLDWCVSFCSRPNCAYALPTTQEDAFYSHTPLVGGGVWSLPGVGRPDQRKLVLSSVFGLHDQNIVLLSCVFTCGSSIDEEIW